MYWWSSVRELLRRRAVVAERLLDDDASVLRQPRLRQALDDGAEEERRDLEVEDRALGAVDRLGDALVRGRIGEIAGDVGEPVGEALEDLRVELLAGTFDRVPCALLQLVDRPVVHGHAHDRTVDQASPLEPVERHERHHLRQVARDPEGDEDVRRARLLDSRWSGRGVPRWSLLSPLAASCLDGDPRLVAGASALLRPSRRRPSRDPRSSAAARGGPFPRPPMPSCPSSSARRASARRPRPVRSSPSSPCRGT